MGVYMESASSLSGVAPGSVLISYCERRGRKERVARTFYGPPPASEGTCGGEGGVRQRSRAARGKSRQAASTES